MFFKNLKKTLILNKSLYHHSKRITGINSNIKLKPTRYIFHVIWDENYKYCKYKLVYHN